MKQQERLKQGWDVFAVLMPEAPMPALFVQRIDDPESLFGSPGFERLKDLPALLADDNAAIRLAKAAGYLVDGETGRVIAQPLEEGARLASQKFRMTQDRPQ